MSTNSIILSNETILKFQNMIKWLNVWIDQKKTFKTHVQKRLISAIKIFHSISRLQNFEWDLASMITCQLYQSCITSIADYDSKIWWNDQKSYAQKFQKLQNLRLRKILKFFKTSSISIMKIKINVQSIKIRLNQKNQILTLRIMTLDQRHSIRSKNFWNHFFKQTYESTETTETKSEFRFMKSIIEKNQFLNWNQFKKQSTHLIKILQLISKINFDFDCDLIENFNYMIAPWQNSIQSIDLQINSAKKSIIRKNHFQLTKQILNQKNTAVFYTDEAHDEKSKISAASVVLY